MGRALTIRQVATVSGKPVRAAIASASRSAATLPLGTKCVAPC